MRGELSAAARPIRETPSLSPNTLTVPLSASPATTTAVAAGGCRANLEKA
jgi:hypothetical protein